MRARRGGSLTGKLLPKYEGMGWRGCLPCVWDGNAWWRGSSAILWPRAALTNSDGLKTTIYSYSPLLSTRP